MACKHRSINSALVFFLSFFIFFSFGSPSRLIVADDLFCVVLFYSLFCRLQLFGARKSTVCHVHMEVVNGIGIGNAIVGRQCCRLRHWTFTKTNEKPFKNESERKIWAKRMEENMKIVTPTVSWRSSVKEMITRQPSRTGSLSGRLNLWSVLFWMCDNSQCSHVLFFSSLDGLWYVGLHLCDFFLVRKWEKPNGNVSKWK